METIKTDPDQPQDINHLKFFSDSGTIKVKEERISDSEVESDYDDFKRDISEAHLDDVGSTAIFDVSVKSERIDFKEELDPEIQSDSLPISNGIQLEAQFPTFLDSNTEVEKNDSNPDLGTEFHFDEASGDEFCFSWNGDSEPELTTSDSENDAEDQKEVPVTKIKKRKLEPWSWRSNCVLRSDELSEETFCGSAGLSCEVSALGSSVEIADITFRFLDEDFWEMLRDGCNRPRKTAVAAFRLLTNHDCLASHLYRIDISASPICVLCNDPAEMNEDQLQTCEALRSEETTVQKYWKARLLMASLPNARH
ncbi:hypothetical protein ANN_00279 [Periplaneta americana]|uniref:Uncharacterized protein n=1 Tax=Periplaneta americana TaxID=6978 RepID=A0ABQ8TQB7_PERAM|nr:hypothetical protein ANN_00279 [Periplaneta americana]